MKDPVANFLVVWMAATVLAAVACYLVTEFSPAKRRARRHERDWVRLKKYCAALRMACPSRKFSDTLSDLNYYEVPGP
jgi:hypothetical protein